MTRVFAALCFGVLLVGCHSAPRPSSYLPTAPTAPVADPQPSPPPSYGQEPILGTGIAISPGEVVQTSVARSDPFCFPFWDLTGQCRQFDLTATQDGTLEVRLSWSEPVFEMTAFVVHPSVGWISSDWPIVGREARLRVSVTAGSTYHLLMMSYKPPENFALMATIRPN